MSKRALCVGINDYPGTGNDLYGCVNDAKDWQAELEKRGYQVTTLIDSQATRQAMVQALQSLVAGGKAGDKLVFTYSGHGSWLPDDDGDEADGRDEMLCPYDINSGQYLVDDDLAAIFDAKVTGVDLYFISDSCHSGTVAKFAPMMAGLPQPKLPKARFLPPGTFLKGARDLVRLQRVALTGRSTRQKYPALLAAGCQDIQLSYDADFNGRPNGAFTYVALQALKTNPATPKAWMAEIRKSLPSSAYPQTPRLYGGQAAKSGSMF
jgi:hypothetical protein